MTDRHDLAAAGQALRLDKWLWYARFLKSRSLASKLCQSGRIRINGDATAKAHHPVRQGDVLTFPLGHHIRVIKVLEIGARRGPAREARTLYEDMAPPQPKAKREAREVPAGRRERGQGRPTKSDRRAIDRLMGKIFGRFHRKG